MNPGEVSITLDGKAETLRSTLRAARIVSSLGGFTGALKLLQEFNLEGYVAIVAAGLNKRTIDVEDAVYKTGLVELTGPLSDFVILLTQGGRPVAASGDAGAGEK